MNLTIYKYSIPSDDYFQIELPVEAKILTIQIQHGNPQMWVLLDPSKPVVPRYFRRSGTGHLINEPLEDLEYIGTCQGSYDHLILHLFEINKLSLVQKNILQVEAGNITEQA